MADSYIGRTVRKEFPGYSEPFRGKVTGLTKAKGKRYFRVVYDDGDSEDMTLKELQEVLIGSGEAADGSKRKAVEGAPGEAPASAKRGRNTDGREDAAKHAPPAAATSQPATEPRREKQGEQSRAKKADPAATAAAAPGHGSLLQRFPYAGQGQRTTGAPAASRAVACGSLLFMSDISPRQEGMTPAEEASTPAPMYAQQAKRALAELDAMLRDAGSGRELLVQVQVKLKDAELGRQAFVEEWNEWIGEGALPALSIWEAFMGTQDRLVALAAVAAYQPRI